MCKQVVIPVTAVCSRCEREGLALVGIQRLVKFNPRSNLVGLACLCCLGVGMCAASVVLWVFPLSVPPNPLTYLSVPVGIIVMGIVERVFPLRALVCPGCRKVRAWGWGRKIPLYWKEYLAFQGICTNFGHSLVGAVSPRCPECGDPFPKEWLAVTRLGDPHIQVDIDVWSADHTMECK